MLVAVSDKYYYHPILINISRDKENKSGFTYYLNDP